MRPFQTMNLSRQGEPLYRELADLTLDTDPYTAADATAPATANGSADATTPATAAGTADTATGLPAGTSVTAIAVPYYAWANRGPDPMRVWLPLVP